MRALVQRVDGASVEVDGSVVGAINGSGLLALIGVTHSDGSQEAQTIARKLCELRILPGEESVLAAGASILVVSQFTLYGDTRKGRRPSWSKAAPGEHASALIDEVVDAIKERGVQVSTGQFGAQMRVSLVNDGPFTVLVEA